MICNYNNLFKYTTTKSKFKHLQEGKRINSENRHGDDHKTEIKKEREYKMRETKQD